MRLANAADEITHEDNHQIELFNAIMNKYFVVNLLLMTLQGCNAFYVNQPRLLSIVERGQLTLL